MNAVLRSALLVSGIAAAVTTVAAAQNTYQQQITNQLTRAASAISGQGYVADRAPVMGSLNDDANEGVLIQLNAGARYAILGVCDNDCTDVDLRIFDPMGNQLDQDLEVDDTPVLEFVASSSGQYRVQVLMATCNQNPCYYGVQVFVRGAGGK
jgi:hypothetical protein